jgi:hypothetical protein
MTKKAKDPFRMILLKKAPISSDIDAFAIFLKKVV